MAIHFWADRWAFHWSLLPFHLFHWFANRNIFKVLSMFTSWCICHDFLLSVLISVLGCVVVKPDPPVNVSVMVMPGKKLSVQWGPPPTWPDPVNFLLKYTVKYHWGKPETARTVSFLCRQCSSVKAVKYLKNHQTEQLKQYLQSYLIQEGNI